MKKVVALILALMMVLSLATMAFAKINIRQEDVKKEYPQSLVVSVLSKVFPNYKTLTSSPVAKDVLKKYNSQVETWAEAIGEKVYTKVYKRATDVSSNTDILEVLHLSSNTNLGRIVKNTWDNYFSDFANQTVADVIGTRVATTVFYLVSFYPYY